MAGNVGTCRLLQAELDGGGQGGLGGGVAASAWGSEGHSLGHTRACANTTPHFSGLPSPVLLLAYPITCLLPGHGST